MSRFEFRLSDIGEGIAEAELVEWLVDLGDEVREDQPLVSVMTDKATVELESPVAGRVIERRGEIGETIRVGATLLAIDTSADLPVEEIEAPPELGTRTAKIVLAPSPPPAPPPSAGKVLASPVVRRRARELGIDLSTVPHEGPRVMNADLETFLRDTIEPQGQRPAGGLQDREIPVIGLRRSIARRMEEAKQHIPHFTYVDEIDMTAFERLRGELNTQREDLDLTPVPLLIAAICRTLPDYPQLNAHYYDDKDVIRRFGAVHVGIATQTDAGLMVPVVRDAERMDIWQLAEAIAASAEQTRSGSIGRDALRGSTITLTSLGKLGGIASTPIVNRPEVCIIAPNRIVERPVWKDGAVVPRLMMNLSISCDHRVVDGYDAAAFVQALKDRLESPALIFIEP